ncbi:hypothetical protein G9A89_003467 [Geosiphon pyriformis]|nr:hypothetical protein G9A89_003467 [Geosiphon pyriformis]
MAYASIAKLEKFSTITTNNWDDKPQTFNVFKLEFLRYFSNSNSINHLANTFTIIKQRDIETVTTYLKCFYQNLCQIQAINADYFIAAQILNQFIYGLCNNILQCVYLMYPVDLQAAVTHARDFKAVKLKANYAQAVNLVMNRLFDLDSKPFINLHNNATIKETEIASKISHIQYHPQPININNNQTISIETPITDYKLRITSVINHQNNTNLNYITLYILGSNINLSTDNTCNLSTTTATNNLSDTSNLNSKFSLAIGITLVEFRNQVYPKPKFSELFNNIPPATIINNKLLAAIFPFKLEKLTSIFLFSRAALKEKPITAMYTNAKVNGHSIKLILDSCQVDCTVSARIITADGMTKTSISKIDDFLFEVNGIITSIKVLVMEAIQYQALVGNDWLVKTNAVLD